MTKRKSRFHKRVKAAAGKAVGKVAGPVRRKLAGERMCESCRKRVATHWSNRMHQCGHCARPVVGSGGGRSWERRNLPRGHEIRAGRQSRG